MNQSAGAADRRLLLVHAHPDDETLTTGGTMATYAAQGVDVTLVTCTLGEEGEVLLPELAHLAAEHHDALGPHRLTELAAAMEILGISDHRRLGGDGHYRDSGMVGTPANNRADCFWRADLLEAATHLVAVIREVRPQVMITYDDFGGYGHPDHIQAHRVAMYAAVLAAAPSFRPDLGDPWEIAKIYWPAIPRGVMMRAMAAMPAEQREAIERDIDPQNAPFLVDDELITTVVDARDYEPVKLDALRAHATQIDAEAPFLAMSALMGPDALGLEYFRIARGPLAPAGSPAAGSPAAGSPASGSPAFGSPAAGSPAAGSPGSGSPASGSPASGSPAAGSPASGSPASGSPARLPLPAGLETDLFAGLNL